MSLNLIIHKPKEVNLAVQGNGYKISGKLGFVFLNIRGVLSIVDDSTLNLVSINKKYLMLNLKLIKQCLRGVSVGYKKRLRLKGLGYTAEIVENSVLSLKLGFSNKININIPDGIIVKIKKRRIIYFLGFDLLEITKFMAFIRSYRVPDCYKGKGILYQKEIVRLKPGKKN